MNKKIAGEFAIGIILLAAIIVGAIFWISSAGQSDESYQGVQTTLLTKKQQKDPVKLKDKECIPHYYEGKTDIQGWIVSSEQGSENEIVVQLKKDEEKKLPIKESEIIADFKVKLIDPTDKVLKDLRLATEEKPVTFTIQGYAEVCSQPPLVSLKQATVAFKRS